MTLCCCCIIFLALIFVAFLDGSVIRQKALWGPTGFAYGTNAEPYVGQNGTASAAWVSNRGGWSLTAKLMQRDQQGLLCNLFQLTSKPYWMIYCMAGFETLWAFLMSSTAEVKFSCIGVCSMLALAYKLLGTFYEMILIGTKVADVALPPGYHAAITTWDKYELTVYLWTQSSVGSNIAGLFLALTIPFMRGFLGLEATVHPEGEKTAGHILEREQALGVKGCMFVTFFLPLLAPIITHAIPALCIYPWMLFGIFSFALFFLGVLISIILIVDWASSTLDDGSEAKGLSIPPFLFIAMTVVTQTYISYAIQVYGRSFSDANGGYLSFVVDEFDSRSTTAYLDCVMRGAPATVFDTVRAFI